MATLSTSNLLRYIYKRNCAVRHPTAITMEEFCNEFPSASYNDIAENLDHLIQGGLIVLKFSHAYDLTEDGLSEVLRIGSC